VPGVLDDAWNEPIDPRRLLTAEAFAHQDDGRRRVETYWRGKTRRTVLTSLPTHNDLHLGEATCLKSIIRRAAAG
jgi:hypothetical protein